LKQLAQAGVRVFAYLGNREVALDSALDKVMVSLSAFAADLERGCITGPIRKPK
jgi:hypothetical protein